MGRSRKSKKRSSRKGRKSYANANANAKTNLIRTSRFTIYCQDALKWLKTQPDHSLGNVVTGIPDMDETPYSLSKYLDFVRRSASLIFEKVSQRGYCLFMNTDRKYKGVWVDKAFIIQEEAKRAKIGLKWHKIILLRPVNSTHIQRPTYQHYLCFSYEGGPGEATPDVIMCGKKEYKNASCPNGLRHAIDFIKRYGKSPQVIDPFVGRGSTLVEAKKRGLTGIGVDLDKAQCSKARKALA